MPKIGEFELIDQIRKYATPATPSTIGIGDDCAVIPQRDGLDTLVSTDMLIEGTHFLKEDITPRQLGWKSAAVNISDIAAMGGKPIATFLSLALPKTLPETWVQEFMEGYRDISQKHCVALLGGDTTCSPDRICINVAVLGTCPSGSAKLRSAALPGDMVCVTGTLGDSAAGLKLILSNDKAASPQLVQKHYCPLPKSAGRPAARKLPRRARHDGHLRRSGLRPETYPKGKRSGRSNRHRQSSTVRRPSVHLQGKSLGPQAACPLRRGRL